jgi:hypothetical protein
MYVYRDTGDRAADSPALDAAERDAAYWYDLLAEDAVPKLEETRGPFEPLVSSSGPATGAATAAEPGRTERGQAPLDEAHDDGPDEKAQARARKLEQIKDLYLTAGAIGEHNVDKHFDQLLAQQRELISEYFSQSAAPPAVASPRDGLSAEADTQPHHRYQPHGRRDPDAPGMTGGQAGWPEGAGVAAEPPRAW